MTVFDPNEGEHRKREAIDRVELNADNRWKEAAAEVVRRVASDRAEFTTDRIWALLEKDHPNLGPPHEPRAMGAVMRKAAKAGLIEKTDRVTRTERPEAHRRDITVWRSLKHGSVGIGAGCLRQQGGGKVEPASVDSSVPGQSAGERDSGRPPTSVPASERSVPNLFDADADWNAA